MITERVDMSISYNSDSSEPRFDLLRDGDIAITVTKEIIFWERGEARDDADMVVWAHMFLLAARLQILLGVEEPEELLREKTKQTVDEVFGHTNELWNLVIGDRHPNAG